MAPALTSDITTRPTEGLLAVSPPIISQETSKVTQPRSLKEELQNRLINTGFGISTQATLLSTSLIVSPRERGKPLVVSSSLGKHTMNPPVNDTNKDSTNSALKKPQATLSSKPSTTPAMGLTQAEHPKASSSGKPDTAVASTSSNGVNSLHHVTSSTVATSSSTVTSGKSTTNPATTIYIEQHSSTVRVTLDSATTKCESRQKELQVRSARILRRLRRLQNRQSISHVRQQMSGLVDYQKNTLHLQAKSLDDDDGKSTVLQDKNVKNMSTSALVNLVQSWQSRNGQPSRSAPRPQEEPEPQTRLDEDLCVELDRVAGNLKTNLSHLEQALDSDATESSSGGESCDDMDFDDWDGKTQRPALTRRAEWQWSQDRSRIAAKWTWLQAQVSDLEYRIRQQNDIYRQVRQSKGSVVLADHPVLSVTATTEDKSRQLVEASPLNVSQVLSNVDKQSSHLTKQLGNVYSPAQPPGPNGLVSTTTTPEQSSSQTLASDQQQCGADASCVAARCRPVKAVRPRKLLRTAGIHHLSRKASRLSTVRCGCYPPRPPCALCGGRYNNTQPLQPYTLTPHEKVSLLDPAYHPVLSFDQDAPLALQFETLLKTGEWQQLRHSSKGYMHMGPNRTKSQVKEKPRKYKQRIPKSVSHSTAMLNRIKSKYEQKQLCRNASGLPAPKADSNGQLPHKIRKRKPGMFGSNTDSMRKRQRLSSSATGLGGRMSTRHHGDHHLSRSSESGTLKDMKDAAQKKRRTENAFDINNIVIPYSIAASTRVEKLQYKEIATPKWRELKDSQPKANNNHEPATVSKPVIKPTTSKVDTNKARTATTHTIATEVPGVKIITDTNNRNGYVPMLPAKGESTDEEDLSEEGAIARHNRCEVNEKKKFMSYMIAQRRGRGHRSESTTDTTTPGQTPTPGETTASTENNAGGGGGGSNTVIDAQSLPSAADVIAELDSYRNHHRHRSDSMAAADLAMSFALASQRAVSPWPMRQFPMSEREFDDILERDAEARREMHVPASVSSATTSSAMLEEVVDEEWAVQEGQSNKLVLKLTKR